MIPVEQQQLSDRANGQAGDCWKCCIASILELDYDEVPHFYQDEADATEWYSGWNATIDFLRPRGFALAQYGLWGQETPYLDYGGKGERIAEEHGIRYHFSAPGHWIASVVSPRLWDDCEPCVGSGVFIDKIGRRYPSKVCRACNGTKGSRGLHAVVMQADRVVFDPHPLREMGHLGFRQAFLLTHI